MGKRLRLEDQRDQAQIGGPQPGTEVKIAVDLSRSKWVYCVRWQGAERLRLSTSGEIKHLQALVRRYEGCPVHLAFEAVADHAKTQFSGRRPSGRIVPPGLPFPVDPIGTGTGTVRLAFKTEGLGG